MPNPITQEKCKIEIHSANGIAHFEIRKGLGFQALSAQHETAIEYDCRKADCGICIFKALEGIENLSPPEAHEADFLKAMRADADERLACQCRILGDLVIEVE